MSTALATDLPPNVLVIVVDDVGVDLLSAYGDVGDPAPTPNIDQLAAEGVVFERAYAMPVCSASRAAILTGRYGRRTGVGGVVDETERPFALPAAEVTVPEVLGSVGYTSVAVGKWHLSNREDPDHGLHPNHQGFDHFAGAIGNLGFFADSYFDWSKNVDGRFEQSTTYATTDTANEAIAAITETPEPWFLYVSFNAPHTPVHTPPPQLVPSGNRGETFPDAVRAMTEAMDTELGRVLDAVPPAVRERTTVVFLSDNGTTSEAVVRPFDPRDARGLPTEGGTHVPLIVAGAGVTAPGGSRSRALVHVVDLFPTVAELAGVDPGALAAEDGAPLVLDGASLVPQLADPDVPSPRAFVYTEKFAPNGPPPYRERDWAAVRDERYLYARGVGVDGAWEALFDVESTWPVPGPELLRDGQSAAERWVVASLRDELEAYQASLTYDHE